ncbi:YBR259W [Saccharomyces arboricola H-6]|uniref:YBR259W n=1 Tax=Saccharomyces arboricola (strain H-6 / AS 2.3317 / CBS 10644) TaxID=1160507 RepID=J8LRC9_SACAR|nr:YBR259W [Saccharomyces arboricola H-6]
MSIQETLVKYTNVVDHLATGDLKRTVIKSAKLAQVIAGSKVPLQLDHKLYNGKAVIYKCIEKALSASVTSLSSGISPDTNISQFLHLEYVYQTHFQALSGQIKKYCGMKRYYELKYAAVDRFETGGQTDGLTLLRIWAISFDEFIKSEQRCSLDIGAKFRRFYTLLAEYSSWRWASDSKRQYTFMCQFRTKLIECLANFYEGIGPKESHDSLNEFIMPWERAVSIAKNIDSFTGEELRIDGAELFWGFRNRMFSSIYSLILGLGDLQHIFNAFQPYGEDTLIQDFARIRSLKWDKDDTVERLVYSLIFNDMFPYFSPKQMETMKDGIHFLRLLRKNFQESIIDVKEFHVEVMKYLNSQLKSNYNSLVQSSKIQDTNHSTDMTSYVLNDDKKIQINLSSLDGYTHTVADEGPLWQHKLYPRIYTNEQAPISDTSGVLESHKLYAIISLLRYYLPESKKFFHIYYLPSIFKRILYYSTKFGHLYSMDNCLERQIIESLTVLEPSLVHVVNNMVQSSIESLKNVTLINNDKTSSSVILLPQKKFKSLCELNKTFNEPFWPNELLANSWPGLANKRLESGQILHDAFAFHLFEIELPIIIDSARNIHLKLVSNMCTTSILYLYNEADSLPLATMQEKLAVLPVSKRNEILLNNLKRLTKLKLLLLREDKEGQKVYAFNFNYKFIGQNTSIIRLI